MIAAQEKNQSPFPILLLVSSILSLELESRTPLPNTLKQTSNRDQTLDIRKERQLQSKATTANMMNDAIVVSTSSQHHVDGTQQQQQLDDGLSSEISKTMMGRGSNNDDDGCREDDTTESTAMDNDDDKSDDDKNDDSATVPTEFLCPLTLEVMVDPVISKYGKNFERSAIIQWLGQGNTTCPLTRQPLKLCDLITDHKLRFRIHSYQKQHGDVSLLMNANNCYTNYANDTFLLEDNIIGYITLDSTNDRTERAEDDPVIILELRDNVSGSSSRSRRSHRNRSSRQRSRTAPSSSRPVVSSTSRPATITEQPSQPQRQDDTRAANKPMNRSFFRRLLCGPRI